MVDVLRFFFGQFFWSLDSIDECVELTKIVSRTRRDFMGTWIIEVFEITSSHLWVSLAGYRRHQRQVTSVKLSTGVLLRVDSLKEKQSCCLGLSLTELGLQQNRNRWNSDSTKKHRGTPQPLWPVKPILHEALFNTKDLAWPKIEARGYSQITTQSIKQNHQVRRSIYLFGSSVNLPKNPAANFISGEDSIRLNLASISRAQERFNILGKLPPLGTSLRTSLA